MLKILKRSTYNNLLNEINVHKEKALVSERKKKEAVSRMKGANRRYEKLTEIDITKIALWSKEVREAGSCDICNTINDLTSHHLWDKASHPSLAYEAENGVCLCKPCHVEFHQFCKPPLTSSPAKYLEFKKQKQLL